MTNHIHSRSFGSFHASPPSSPRSIGDPSPYRREGHGADTSLKANSELALLRIERMVTSVGGALWHAIADVGLAGGILGVSTRELESDCDMGAQHFFLTD